MKPNIVKKHKYNLNIVHQTLNTIFITKKQNWHYINSDYYIKINGLDYSFYVARGVYDEKKRKMLNPSMVATGSAGSHNEAIEKGIDIILKRD